MAPGYDSAQKEVDSVVEIIAGENGVPVLLRRYGAGALHRRAGLRALHSLRGQHRHLRCLRHATRRQPYFHCLVSGNRTRKAN